MAQNENIALLGVFVDASCSQKGRNKWLNEKQKNVKASNKNIKVTHTNIMAINVTTAITNAILLLFEEDVESSTNNNESDSSNSGNHPIEY